MAKGNRPTTCANSGKRLRGKSWYYRNGKYFYNKGAWNQEKEKLAKEGAKTKEESKEKPSPAEKASAAPESKATA